MAQEKYGFFDSSGEDRRSYNAADMAIAFHSLASNGVAALGTNLQVTAEGSTMRTLVGYGTAMIEGYYYKLRDDGSGIQAFTHTTEAELNRIDRIVLRLDFTARTITIVKLIGTAAATPEAPELTRDDEIYEISLAQVLIRAGSEEILQSDITDERGDDVACGLIAPESLRRSTIAQLINEAVGEAMETLDDVLRFTNQTLEPAAKSQARGNIGAQERIAANGMLKGDGNGGVTAAASGTDYALPVRAVTVTLPANGWSPTGDHNFLWVGVEGILEGSKAVIGLSSNASTEQYEAALNAQLFSNGGGDGYVSIIAYGEKPTIDLPVLVLILG